MCDYWLGLDFQYILRINTFYHNLSQFTMVTCSTHIYYHKLTLSATFYHILRKFSTIYHSWPSYTVLFADHKLLSVVDICNHILPQLTVASTSIFPHGYIHLLIHTYTHIYKNRARSSKGRESIFIAKIILFLYKLQKYRFPSFGNERQE